MINGILKKNIKIQKLLLKSEIESVLMGEVTTNYSKRNKINLINEKIRLLYVGITRAKEMLILSCSSYKDKSEVGKKNKEQKPSLYLNELEKYIEKRKKEVIINE